MIAKRGSQDRFLRVCQWRLDRRRSLSAVLGVLVEEALRNRALGVRWAVYGGQAFSEGLVAGMRLRGFLCARRTRIVMIHKSDERCLDQTLWQMNDSLFSFDP